MRCVISPLAERDLEEIGDYIAKDNPARAVTFIRDLRDRCTQLGDYPEAAPLRPALGPGIRMVPFGRYLIFYTIGAGEVRIERAIHSARNIEALFNG
jgi:toxin ParE1/3/4